jgi:hypothetical protein
MLLDATLSSGLCYSANGSLYIGSGPAVLNEPCKYQKHGSPFKLELSQARLDWVSEYASNATFPGDRNPSGFRRERSGNANGKLMPDLVFHLNQSPLPVSFWMNPQRTSRHLAIASRPSFGS